MALSLIKDLIKFKPSERASLKDVLKSQFFRPDQPYLIYDTPNSSKPGLCVIISQGKYHNVFTFKTNSIENNDKLINIIIFSSQRWI